MIDHVAGRDEMLDMLRRELVGPAPAGDEVDCGKPVSFAEAAESFKPHRQKGSGEEILQRDPPTRRYGIGVLYPAGTQVGDSPGDVGAAGTGFTASTQEARDGAGEDAGMLSQKLEKQLAAVADDAPEDAGSDDFDVSGANTYRPSTMGVSFLADVRPGSTMKVSVSGGRYQSLQVEVEGKPRAWWLRVPVSLTADYDAEDLCTPRARSVSAAHSEASNTGQLDLKVEVFSRPHGGDRRRRLVTVCLVNRTAASEHADESCFFQSAFRVDVMASDGKGCILSYPRHASSKLDEEEQSLALLYRMQETYAVGHGCAADWDRRVEGGRAHWVRAECLPTFEVPSVTPDVPRDEGGLLQVPMAALAGLDAEDDGQGQLSEVIGLYEQWIARKQRQIPGLDEGYREAATRHLRECERCVGRMKDGLAYLNSDRIAYRAFQLANEAIWLQQLRTRRESRAAVYDEKAKRILFSEPYPELGCLQGDGERGRWRPFQIAFLLMSIRSTAEPEAADRCTVELIWFPTGGGKTEAYLGLAAFALFMRRLRDQQDAGVHVLMRYTLRLLTTQQFQRASGLVCAMEHIRREHANELGTVPFSIGIWVGSDNTPNRRSDAITQLHSLQKADRGAKNHFVLGRCPWCGAQMGALSHGRKAPKYAPRVLGYEEEAGTVVYRCPDQHCEFRSGIPVYVIDEDIYTIRPSLLIGTVDKFAMLAWRPEARALFGIDTSGERTCSPPGLVIQDELHLISGPLGSMVGLYEGVIEELCTDRRGPQPVPPKIVSSTATIRRYSDQIRALYGRDDVALFPPPGLEADDSFFARYAREADGSLSHGRLYVGVHAPGLGSMQTVQVRTFTALLQAALGLPSPEARDPWWTLMMFFNSLRELGTTLSLFQSDIPDYFKVLVNRTGQEFSDIRRLNAILELTGRIPSDEVPAAISKLEVRCGSGTDRQVQDVCLASSILEVGIDIDRLSLMAVVGQPKTTSQYIQVTGRVGRRWWERPGLVVTLYGASKPRDRSHFEKFRSYHERLYAQVEPTSVTPFSPPALDRALHAAIVAYARQSGDWAVASSPYPYPGNLVDFLRTVLADRVRAVDPPELAHFEEVFARRAAQWEQWERTKWDSRGSDPEIPLLRVAGEYASPERSRLSWATPMSMRNVDAECEAKITTLYLPEEGA